LGQSYSHWELIIVNDHSADGTEKIIASFDDERIGQFNNPGNGIIHALRHAFEKSTGNYITRMDADDLMPSDKIASMVNVLKHKPRSIVTGKVQYFSEEFEIGDGYGKYENWLNERIDKGDWGEEIFKECPIASPNWMIRRSDFIQIGAFGSDVYPEDYELCFRFLNSQLEVKGINRITHLWRDHSRRVSRTSEVYADNSFLEFKLDMFMKYEYQPNKKLLIWGAGKKGKRAARYLLEKNLEFSWITDNPKKQGLCIYGKQLLKRCEIFNTVNILCLVLTSQDHLAIKDYLKKNKINFRFLC
jgi:glycosyltransferase involved in cell wall biosynthesis